MPQSWAPIQPGEPRHKLNWTSKDVMTAWYKGYLLALEDVFKDIDECGSLEELRDMVGFMQTQLQNSLNDMMRQPEPQQLQ